MKLPLTDTPSRICLLRLSAIGDVSHALPVVRAIQSQWPATEITWICGKHEYRLLKLIKNIRFVVFDKKAGIKEYFRVWKLLRHEQFDVLLHMQVAARANILSLGIKSKIRLGWDKARSRDLHQLFINHSVPQVVQQHQVEGFLSFAHTLGLEAKSIQWDFPVTEEAEKFASEYIDSSRPCIVISACSSHAARNWQADRYAAVADYAIDRYGAQVILSGGPADIEVRMAAQIEQHMSNKAMNLVGKDTLEQLLGLLQHASVVISPDSGPVHLANALGTPVLGLYACTWSRRSGPYHSLEFCVDHFADAAHQFLGKAPDQLAWGTRIEQPGVMELITVDEVKEKLDQLLSR